MKSGLAAFDRPRKTLGFAREAIDDLNLVLDSFFFKEQAFARIIETDPDTGYDVHKIRMVKPLPDRAEARATEAINHIRNAFDQLTFAACTSIGQGPKKDVHFPWRTNPTDLERRFEKKDAVIPVELRDVFRRHEPYPCGDGYSGGDDQIRELARIANDKHTIGLSILGSVPSIRYPNVSGGPLKYLAMPGPSWDAVKNEMIVLIINKGPQVQHNVELTFKVILDQSGPLQGIGVEAALSAFLYKAEDVLEDLVSRCKELGAV